jgi:sulfatase maturation enzyme AslB (radical SAM superfamily)
VLAPSAPSNAYTCVVEITIAFPADNPVIVALDKQVLEHPELKKYYHHSNYYDINEWYETTIYEENVYSNLQNIKLLYITGGEPTLIKKNFELLEKLIDAGYSKNIKLIINSNMTNDKTNFFDLISQFKEVIFFASIDGYGLIQEYIRYPSDWNQVSKNLTKLVNRQAENIMIRVAPVLQITNLNNIVDLFEFCEEFNRKAEKNVVDISSRLVPSKNEKQIFDDEFQLLQVENEPGKVWNN